MSGMQGMFAAVCFAQCWFELPAPEEPVTNVPAVNQPPKEDDTSLIREDGQQ